MTRLRSAAEPVAALAVGVALLAEGAWIAVVYAMLQSAAREPIELGPLVFAAAAASGLIVSRLLAPRLGPTWPAAAVVAVALAALVGWALGSRARADLPSDGAAALVAAHHGGWLLGVAFLRGVAYARPSGERLPAATLLTLGIAAIVPSYLLGSFPPEPWRTSFRDAAFADTVVFVAAALIGLALARIRQLSAFGGFDWRHNPAWLGLLLALVATTLVLAVPTSAAIGPFVLFLVALLPLPLFLAGLVGGLDPRVLRPLGLLAVIAIVAFLVSRLLFGGANPPLPPPPPPGRPGIGEPQQPLVAIGSWVLLLVGLAILVAFLAAAWMRQVRRPAYEDADEERVIDYGDGFEPGRPRSRQPRRRRLPRPRDAVEAYLASLAALEARADLRRLDGETPAEHARRVRVFLGAASASPTDRGASVSHALARLAADFELARFGAVDLTRSEHRRGLSRWESIEAYVRSRRR